MYHLKLCSLRFTLTSFAIFPFLPSSVSYSTINPSLVFCVQRVHQSKLCLFFNTLLSNVSLSSLLFNDLLTLVHMAEKPCVCSSFARRTLFRLPSANNRLPTGFLVDMISLVRCSMLGFGGLRLVASRILCHSVSARSP